MKMLTAVIKPFKAEDVRDALAHVGVQGLTITEVKGFGRQKGHTELYRGAEYVVDFVPKVKLELAVREDQLDQAIDKAQQQDGDPSDSAMDIFGPHSDPDDERKELSWKLMPLLEALV